MKLEVSDEGIICLDKAVRLAIKDEKVRGSELLTYAELIGLLSPLVAEAQGNIYEKQQQQRAARLESSDNGDVR